METSKGRGSPKVGKSESPEDVGKPEVGSPKSEGEKFVPDNLNPAIQNKSETAKPSLTPENKSEIKEPLTTHNSPLTNMEVHHHPEVEKKGFKEYLLEGLMIFLAVTMGFFAESLREHIADRHREREYMVSMVEDLKSDTASLSSIIRYGQSRNEMIDSLLLLMSSPGAKENRNSLYFFARSISIPEHIFFNDRTIQQLKSSGSLRLIENIKVSDGIMAYDQKLKVQYFDMNEAVVLRENYRQQVVKVFDTKVFIGMQQGDEIVRPINNPRLFSTDAALVNAYMGAALYLKKLNGQRVREAIDLLAQAKQLTELINKEYNLE